MKPKLKPILFNTEMVQAICDGRKTVTRRIIKPQPKMILSYISGGWGAGRWSYPSKDTYKYWGDPYRLVEGISEEDKNLLWTPPCHTDDVLYVRETWRPISGTTGEYDYYADVPHRDRDVPVAWKPSIHMPKDAARLFLKVKNVSVERLQDITMEDIEREGVVPSCRMCSFNSLLKEHKISCEKYILKATDCKLEMMFDNTGFSRAWDSTISKKDLPLYGWNANPFVWRIEFERISKGEVGYYVEP